MSRALAWEWLGLVPYPEALERQRERRDALLAGQADEVLWLLEHPPVVTTGRRPAHGLEAVRAAGIPVVATERGGLATWHGPGQLVAYVLVDAGRRGLGARALVSVLEGTVIQWLAGHGVQAGPRNGLPGVWVERDKLCAVGLHLSRGVSMHGLALNLCPDLGAFGLFQPCGVTDGGVTSLHALIGAAPTPAEAAASLGPALVNALEGAAAATRQIHFAEDVDAAGAGQ